MTRAVVALALAALVGGGGTPPPRGPRTARTGEEAKRLCDQWRGHGGHGTVTLRHPDGRPISVSLASLKYTPRLRPRPPRPAPSDGAQGIAPALPRRKRRGRVTSRADRHKTGV